MEEFLDCLDKVEQFFERKEVLDDKRVKFASLKLKGRALVLWKQVQFDRLGDREGKN